jgi:lipid II:glycine glycyltransferase (peptidoglycan interpeptide bridge formation enzyme)
VARASTLRFATAVEIDQWNSLVLASDGNLLQGYELGQQKTLIGWKPRYVMAGDLAILILEKKFIFFGSHWYIPKGPSAKTLADMKTLLPLIKQFARQQHVMVVTLDPELPKVADIGSMGLLDHYVIQANITTRIMDISASPEVLMASLSQKTRHAIKRAERDGAKVKQVETTEENCRLMYDLMLETADGRYQIFPYDYYKTYWQRYDVGNMGGLFFAYVDDGVIAAAYVHVFGHKAVYKDGASVRRRTVYGASHLLQWRAILWLKSRGAVEYDLCGAPPRSHTNNRAHRLYGVGLFKAGFAPEVTEYAGTFDLIVRPITGALWHKIGERLVAAFYRRVLKRSYY